jgi:hypothetical protein
MKKGLFEKIPFQAETDLSRVQDRVADTFDKLATAHDVISSPVVRMIASGVVAAGSAVIVFAGGPGCTLTLPTAANQGTSIASVMMFLNRASVAVTLKPSTGEKVKGATSLSVAAGTLAILASDGVSQWFSQ